MPLRKSVAISRSDSSSFRDWMNFCVRVFAGSGRSTRMHVPVCAEGGSSQLENMSALTSLAPEMAEGREAVEGTYTSCAR